MPYQIEISETVPGPVLELRRTVRAERIGDDIGAGLAELYTKAAEAGLHPVGPPAVTYLDTMTTDRPMSVDIDVPVAPGTGHAEIGDGARIVGRHARPVARTVHTGGYATLGAAYDALEKWIAGHGYRTAGPPTETYLVGPDSAADAAGYRTEVCVPIVPSVGLTLRVPQDVTTTVGHTREALSAAGFSVLSETDMRAVLRERLGAEIEDYRLLGVCTPDLALRVLEADRQAGLLLPCTVLVRAAGTGSLVEVLDPAILARATGLAELGAIAGELRERLDAVLDALRERAR